MFEDDEREFDPSESEEFLKAINEVLDLPQDYESDTINIETNVSQIIDIPDEAVEEKAETGDNELDEYNVALAQNIADLFGDAEATEEAEPMDVLCESDDIVEVENTEEKSFEDEFPEENLSGEEDIIDDINAALALQVNEMSATSSTKEKPKKWLLTLIPLVGIVFLFTKFRKGMPKWLMGIRIAVFSVFAVFLISIFASNGKIIYNMAGMYLRWRMPGQATTPTPPIKPTGTIQQPIQSGGVATTPGQDETDPPVVVPGNQPRVEEHIINILLLGEEKIGSEHSRGRTDLIMIATLDTKQRTVKLTSIMRDILVAIPGYSDNRINSVYATGGIDLLREVIELNFEIVPDGYMLVDFNSFEKIIDNLNGVTIELSEEEAEYLNTTNYISNPAYRNVVAGVNRMNGNQALGYCRVRHIPTIDNVYADFGRTSRQRVVLNAIFEKMKTKNLFQLAITADSCLPLVETDLSAAQISDYMEKAVESKITSFVQMRIPINGSFADATYNGIKDLIQINYPENIKALHEFIFGDYQVD